MKKRNRSKAMHGAFVALVASAPVGCFPDGRGAGDLGKVLTVFPNRDNGAMVTSEPSGISCTGQCSALFPTGTQVTLNLAELSDFTFTGWSGACSGNSLSCTVTLDDAKDVGLTVQEDPEVLSVSPLSAANSGGTLITLSGRNFEPGATVTIAGQPASGVTVLSPSLLTCIAPAKAATCAPVDIVVTNPSGQTTTYEAGLKYTPSQLAFTTQGSPATLNSPRLVLLRDFSQMKKRRQDSYKGWSRA